MERKIIIIKDYYLKVNEILQKIDSNNYNEGKIYKENSIEYFQSCLNIQNDDSKVYYEILDKIKLNLKDFNNLYNFLNFSVDPNSFKSKSKYFYLAAEHYENRYLHISDYPHLLDGKDLLETFYAFQLLKWFKILLSNNEVDKLDVIIRYILFNLIKNNYSEISLEVDSLVDSIFLFGDKIINYNFSCKYYEPVFDDKYVLFLKHFELLIIKLIQVNKSKDSYYSYEYFDEYENQDNSSGFLTHSCDCYETLPDRDDWCAICQSQY